MFTLYKCHAYRPPTSSNSSQFSNDFDWFEPLESDLVKYDNFGIALLTGDMNCLTDEGK